MDLPTIQILSLCSGIGGLDLGVSRALRELGRVPRALTYVEGEAYAAAVLANKMEKGHLDPAPIWSDLKTLNGSDYSGRVDLIIGGYPCQPFSVAGLGLGEEDPRHLWPYITKIIQTCRPGAVFFENVRGHVKRGLKEVISDLSRLGFDAEWDVFSAEEEGAPHLRERVFILAAHPDRAKLRKQPRRRSWSNGGSAAIAGNDGPTESLVDPLGSRLEKPPISRFESKDSRPGGPGWWSIEPGMGRVAHGVAQRVDRIRALGNAVVPACARRAFLELNERLI